MPTRVDLSDVRIVDNHCHPFTLSEMTAAPPADFLTRLSHLGMMMTFDSELSDVPVDAGPWAAARAQAEASLFGSSLLRWLGELLGCEPALEEVEQARSSAVKRDAAGYTRRLLDDQHIVAVLEAGRPQSPQVPPSEFKDAVGVQVYSVARVETLIDKYREESFSGLVNGLESDLHGAAASGSCLAFKSLIAYRAGLAVRNPTAAEATQAHARWQASGWKTTPTVNKPMYDFLLHRVMLVARDVDRPVHIHCGAALDDFTSTRPGGLAPFLAKYSAQPVVLIHSGYPWVVEAAAMATELPNVFLDISGITPWGTTVVESSLEACLGILPWGRVLYGSDSPGHDPEAFWMAARIARQALSRVLERTIERDFLTRAQVETIGIAILGSNCQLLHGVTI